MYKRYLVRFFVVLLGLSTLSCGNYSTPEKTDLLVPIQLDGWDKTYWMVLDTGRDRTIFYENTLVHLMYKERVTDNLTENPDGSYTFSASGTLGGLNIRVVEFDVEPETGKKLPTYGKGVIGALGLDFLGTRITVIDFPRNRIRIYSDVDSLPEELKKDHLYVTGSMDSGKFVLPVGFGRKEYPLYYDSTESGITLRVVPSLWNELAGITTKNTAFEVFKGEVRGIPYTAVGTECVMPVEIGNASYTGITVYKNRDDTLLVPYDRYGSVGVLGNVLFREDSIVILDFIRNRFGLLPYMGTKHRRFSRSEG